MTIFRYIICAFILPILLACTPVVHNRGYVFSQKALDNITKGTSDKETVQAIMGSPSVIATIDGTAFYYISSRMEAYTYRAPVETDRRVVAIYFDTNNIVKDFGAYGLEDGNIVAFVERETETRGRELTLLNQLFGNLGRFSSGNESAIPGSTRSRAR